MALSPHAEKLAKKFGIEQEANLWAERTTRLGKLVALKAPRIIVVDNCLLVLHHFGMWRALWSWLRSHYWNNWKINAWLFWQRRVMGLSFDEIEKKIAEE